jgi:hypothetical protein
MAKPNFDCAVTSGARRASAAALASYQQVLRQDLEKPKRVPGAANLALNELR